LTDTEWSKLKIQYFQRCYLYKIFFLFLVDTSKTIADIMGGKVG